MSLRIVSLALLLAVSATVLPASAAPKAKRANAEQQADARARAALRDAVERHVSEAGLTQSLADYGLASQVVQLRRYVDRGKLQLVCVVDLSLTSDTGSVLASVRGNATTIGASASEAVDAAARAAVARLPQALQALREREGTSKERELAQARAQWGAPIR